MSPHNSRIDYFTQQTASVLLAAIFLWMANSAAAGPISIKEGMGTVFRTLPHSSIDGTLKFQTPIARTRLLDQLGVAVVLRHNLVLTGSGRPTSTWIFGGLNTYLVPDGRESLRWRPMSGDDGKFRLSKIGSQFPESWDGPCVIRKSGEQEFEIKLRNGLVWTYRRGVLRKIVVPGFGTIEVKCQGTFIQVLNIQGDPESELFVKYISAGRPLIISAKGGLSTKFDWSDDRLVAWESPWAGNFVLKYIDGLLVRIEHGGSDRVDISWQENPGWWRGDSKWPAPMQIVRFGDELYSFQLKEKGWILTSSLPGKEKGGSVVYNPLQKTFYVQTATGGDEFSLR